MISADKLALRLENILNSHLPSVGSFSLGQLMGGGGGSSSLDQAALVINAIGDLAPELSPGLRESLHQTMLQLREHNWGGIREPAYSASAALAPTALH
jgi:hypothetical protein